MVYGVSGGPIEQFREGWALVVNLNARRMPRPHYWKRQDLTHVYRSLCGCEVDQSEYKPGARVALSPGVFMVDRCKLCSKKHAHSV